MKALVAEHDPLWLAVRGSGGSWEYSIIVADETCTLVKVHGVHDIPPILPASAWKLPPATLIELAKAVVGVAQMERAIGGMLYEDTSSSELSTFGCEMPDEFAPRHLSRSGREGELRLLLIRYPDVQIGASSAKVRLLCRFGDLGGSIQEVTTHFTTGRGVDIAYRTTGLKLLGGQVLEDDEVFRLR
jgi:hypothetical protein